MSETVASAVEEIREVQRLMRRAERSPSYYGSSDGPIENIAPWDRVESAIKDLSWNHAAVDMLSKNGIKISKGWLYDQDGLSLRSHQLNSITVTPDLPREVTVQGNHGRPDYKLTTDVVELPGMGPEARFMPVVKRDGQIMPEAGNRFSAYPTREEAWEKAPVLLRDRIDDGNYKVIPQQKAAQEATMSETTRQEQQSAVSRAWQRVRLDVSRAAERTLEFLHGTGREFRDFSRRTYESERDALRDRPSQASRQSSNVAAVREVTPIAAPDAAVAVAFWNSVRANASEPTAAAQSTQRRGLRQ